MRIRALCESPSGVESRICYKGIEAEREGRPLKLVNHSAGDKTDELEMKHMKGCRN